MTELSANSTYRSSPTDLRLRITLGDQSLPSVPIADVNPEVLEQLKDQCSSHPSRANIEFSEVLLWPDQQRWFILNFAHDVGASAQIDRRIIANPFEAILAAMRATADLEAHRRSLRAAVEAAEVFFGDEPEAAAQRIQERLRELGAPATRIMTLAKQIRSLNPRRPKEPVRDPGAIAANYIDELRRLRNLQAEQMPLGYYRSQFYVFDGTKWVVQPPSYLAAELTGWIHQHGLPNVTRGVCGGHHREPLGHKFNWRRLAAGSAVLSA